MANNSVIHTPTPSLPERFGTWLFKQSANWRIVLAYALVAALTYISIRFNIELGRLSAVDSTSQELLPTGYALLDLAALFLSGYVGLRSRSFLRKILAWSWFFFLLSLSLWAAAAFTMSVDYRQSIAPLEAQIEQKKSELNTQKINVETWQENVKNAERFKTKHQNTLEKEQEKEAIIASEIAKLEARKTPPAQIIYDRTATYLDVTSSSLQLIIRLAWAAALTLSPIVLVLLLAAEIHSQKGNLKRSGVPEQVHQSKEKKALYPNRYIDVLKQVHQKTRKKLTKGTQQDTGIKGNSSNRYQNLKKEITEGRIRPSVRSIKNHFNCRQEVASRYLLALSEEGVIKKHGKGWQLVKGKTVLRAA